MLDKLKTQFNNKYHNTIRIEPLDASLKKNEQEVFNNRTSPVATATTVVTTTATATATTKFKIGDTVKISRVKGLFEKGYLPNWSEAITYVLKDTNGEIISGSSYNEELQKSKQEIFKIERILRKKKIAEIQHGLVKWIRYNSSFNQWIPMTEMHKI